MKKKNAISKPYLETNTGVKITITTLEIILRTLLSTSFFRLEPFFVIQMMKVVINISAKIEVPDSQSFATGLTFFMFLAFKLSINLIKLIKMR